MLRIVDDIQESDRPPGAIGCWGRGDCGGLIAGVGIWGPRAVGRLDGCAGVRWAAGGAVIPASTHSTGLGTEAAGADLRGIKDPVPIAGGWWWVWVLVVVGGLWLAGWLWRKRRRQPVLEAAPAPVVSPHVKARQKLREALEIMHQPRPFCILVSDTIRVYLEERFEFRAPERTTEEFLDELQASALLSLDQKRWLGVFLVRCDLVKFAKYEPAQSELRDLYESALRLVEETEAPLLEAGRSRVVVDGVQASR